MSLLLRRRLRNTPTPILIQRAEKLIQQLPNEERRKRFQARLNQIKELPPEERLWEMIRLLIFLFALMFIAMGIGYALTKVA